MKRKNVLILLLVFMLLLTPSCILFVRALETSPFPEREKITGVEMRFDASGGVKADGAMPYSVDADAPEVALLYTIFKCAERVTRWSLPDNYASYRLTFRGERSDEVLYLYFGASDFSIYVMTSGKKLYRLSMPTLSHRNTVLPPSAASFSLDGEEVVSRYDYPEYANGPTGIAEISLASWLIATEFVFSSENAEVKYRLYDEAGTLLSETEDVSEIVSATPDRVQMDVSADLSGGISVTLHYILKVQK